MLRLLVLSWRSRKSASNCSLKTLRNAARCDCHREGWVLKAQINPHFLFNSLNTLYGTINRGNTEARRLVLNLADVFRYFLQTDRPMILVDEELKIVQAYLFHGDRYKWSARLSIVNITDKEALYNFLSTFSGTHYVTPRAVTGTLAFHF